MKKGGLFARTLKFDARKRIIHTCSTGVHTLIKNRFFCVKDYLSESQLFYKMEHHVQLDILAFAAFTFVFINDISKDTFRILFY